MSTYWKQGLVIGGIYWLFSLIFIIQGSFTALTIDWILSFLLLVFLLPLNKLVPIKRIDKMIKNHPIVTTMLASVGWIPYFTALLAVVVSIVVMIGMENLEKIMLFFVWMEILRKLSALLIVLVVLIAVLVYGKSIAGQLDDHYNVVGNVKGDAKNKAVIVKEIEPKQNNSAVVKVEATAEKAPTKVKTAAKKAPTKTKTDAKKTPVKTKSVAKKAPAKVEAKVKVSSSAKVKSVKNTSTVKKKSVKKKA